MVGLIFLFLIDACKSNINSITELCSKMPMKVVSNGCPTQDLQLAELYLQQNVL